MESTPRVNTQAYNSAYEGAKLIPKFMNDDSDDTRAPRSLSKEQTGSEIPIHGLSMSHSTEIMLSSHPRGRCTGRDKDRATAGISVEIRPLQLLPRHRLRKVGRGHTA